MELTGKCKQDFKKWQQDCDWFQDISIYNENYSNIEIFYTLNKSMQYGVYVDFFDSVGSYISVSGLVLSKTYICDISVISNVEHYYDGFSTRAEARSKAIEKANEIYNN
tara:strand:- start:47 stop:373 length:327 start_codon:yes stop_codon:yes gene_type:complete